MLQLLCASLLLLSAGCATQVDRAPVDLVLRSVTVVDPDAGSVRPNQDILIANGRIREVRTASRRDVAGARLVDAHGRFVIPALWDAHVHLESVRPQGAPRLDPQFWHAPIALSFGVVGMQDMGSRTTEILALRDAFRAKRAAGEPAPILRVAGQAFSGRNPWGSFDHLLVVETPEQAIKNVPAQISRGVDVIKVHDFLEPEVFEAVVQSAREGGMAITGHLRPYSGPVDSAEAGQTNFEHLPPELLSYCGRDGRDEAEKFYAGWYAGGSGYFERSMAALYAKNRSKCPAMFTRLAAMNVTITPTLSSRAPIAARTLAASRRFLPDAYMRSCTQTEAARKAASPADANAYGATVGAVLRGIEDAGAVVVAGTDGVPENCGVPGLVLLDELDGLVAGGLSRAQALQAATSRAAKKAGVADAGVIKEGALADLVILRDDPLRDFSTLEEPDAVVNAGRYIDRAELLALRERAAVYARSLNNAGE